MKKTRVLFVCPLPPPVHGSSMVSQQIRESGLIQGEFECDFVNMSTSRKMSEIGKSGPLLLLKKMARFLGTYFAILGKLICHRYALCYLAITCNGIGFLKDAPFVLLCKLFGRKVVIHQHNKGMSRYADKPIYKQLLKLVYRKSKVILLSWRLYPDISKIVRKEQVMVCPNGIPDMVDDSVLPNCQLASADVSKVPELLYLSNLIESKGVYVVLDACKILKEKGHNFHCTFVGGESKQISIELFNQAVKERGLENCVEYVGPKYGAEKETYWRKTNVFVFPTFYYNETFGLVNLEAMQHKIPVVSTDEGGIPDIVQDGVNGYVVDASILVQESCNDTLGSSATEEEREKSRHFNARRGQQTADAIEKLILDPILCQKFGEAGYEKYQKEFTDVVFENRMLECLKETVLLSKQ